METLDDLAIKYNTDKNSNIHDYARVYDCYLNSHRNTFKNVLEIGVLNASSLKMWGDYFKNADIYGVDINPDCKKYESDRLKVIIMGQDDKNAISDNIYSKNLFFDLIIDDGSHFSNHQINSFNLLFQRVNSGGFYIIEDVCCSYWNSHNGGYKKPDSCIEFCKNLVDHVNFFGFLNGSKLDRNRTHMLNTKPDLSEYEKYIKAIHFHNSCIIIEKV